MCSEYAIVMVVHDGMQYLKEQLESIINQTWTARQVVIFDDNSSDGSGRYAEQLLSGHISDVCLVTNSHWADVSGELYERVGQNFSRALSFVSTEVDFILFADQDDIWMKRRAEHQITRLTSLPAMLMTAGNAGTIDDLSQPTSNTLFEQFGVPSNWAELTDREKFAILLHRPLVTGACVAVRRDFAVSSGVRRPWLHDRWLSLVACARGGLDIDQEIVILYRVHSGQVAGFVGARKGLPLCRDALQNMRSAATKLRSLSSLKRESTPAIRPLLSLRAVVRELLER